MSNSDAADPALRDRSLLSMGSSAAGDASAGADSSSRLGRAVSEARRRRGSPPRARAVVRRDDAATSRPDDISPDEASASHAPIPEPGPSRWQATADRYDAWRRSVLDALRPRASEWSEPAEPDSQPIPHADETARPAAAPHVAARPAPVRSEAISEPDEMLESEERAEPDDGRWRPLIDPGLVIRGVLRSKRAILLATAAGALAGVLVAMNTPKMYHAAAELLADPRDLNIVDRELTQPGNSSEAILALVENQVRIITSGSVLNEVTTRLKLADDPEFNGQGSSGFGRLISNIRALFSSGRGGAADPGRRFALAVGNLAEHISVQRGGRTFVIVVAAETQDPKKSALVANTVTQVFLDTYGRMRSDAAGRAAGELTGKLDELRKSVEAAERKVEAFKSQNDIIDAQGRLITDDEILKLNEQLGVARARTLELGSRAGSLQGVDADSVIGGAAPEALSSASVQELRAQYSTLKGEADRMAARLGPRHPQLIAVQAQLAGARSLLETEIRRVVGSVQTELRRAVQLEQELSSRLAQLKVRQGSLSSELVTVRELERDANAKRAVYEAFLLRARETGEQQGINNANISVISQAQPPLEAEPPSRTTMVAISTVLGFLAGIGIGAARGTAESLGVTLRGRRVRRRVRGAGPGRRARTMFDDRMPAAWEADGQSGSGFGVPGADGDFAPDERRTTMLDTDVVSATTQRGTGRRNKADGPPAPFGQAPAHPYYGYSYAYAHPPESSAAWAGSASGTAETDQDTREELDQIRAGLAECRDALRELSQQRRGRRYF